MKTLKPMLSASLRKDKGESLDDLVYPLVASPKIDGIRCLITNGEAVSSNASCYMIIVMGTSGVTEL